MEKTIQRIKRFSLSCTLNDNGTIRHFHNGHEYVEIGGIKWAVCNVGAEKPTDSGLYFAWGETRGFTAEQVMKGEKGFVWGDYECVNCGFLTKYNNTDKKITLEPLDDAATFNMGIGWRIPTKEEFKALVDSTTCEWVTDYQGSGVAGMVLTDKTDSSKTLFFPAASYCDYGSVYGVGNEGYFWSSSLDTGYPEVAFNLSFSNEGAYCVSFSFRYFGFAVRAVVD